MPQRRREFLTRSSLALAGAALAPSQEPAGRAPSIAEVIERILSEVPPLPGDTVDTLKAGDATRPVTGVVTTFLANCEVIAEAGRLGANLVITHEPTFYNHLDETDWLEGDAVYAYKRELIARHGIAVWRFHDGLHRHDPDGVYAGVLGRLGWERHAVPGVRGLCEVPELSLRELALLFRERLGSTDVRGIGDPGLRCRRVGLVLGAAGGRSQIGFLSRHEVDVLVVGELAEWEVSEYVRDAAHSGRRLGLLVIGHSASEEPGMAWLADWLRPRLPGVGVTHVPVRDPFIQL